MNSVLKRLFQVGIDIGSTTIKTVILDSDGKIIFKSYERHLSQVFDAVKRNLLYVKENLTILTY